MVVANALTAPYVGDALGDLRCALVVRPNAAIERERPLHGEADPIAERAAGQFDVFKRTLEFFGVRVVEVAQPEHLSSAIAIADCALVVRDGAILGRSGVLARRGELEAVTQALRSLEIPILGAIDSPGTVDFGDVVVAGETAYVGITHGTNVAGRSQLRSLLTSAGLNVVEVAVDAGVRRLRSVFCVLDGDTAVVASKKVDVAALRGLKLIDVPPGEEYSGGVLLLNRRHVLADLRFAPANRVLKSNKITVEAIDLYEYMKIGVGPSLMVLAAARKS